MKLIFAFILLALSCGTLFPLSFTTSPLETSSFASFEEIVPLSGCEMPCLFGTELGDFTHDEVIDFLQTHPFTRDSEIEDFRGTISWEWSEAMLPMVTSEGYGLSRYDNVNTIGFRDGMIDSISVAIGFSLGDLIAYLGEEFVIYPFADRGRAGTTYILQFPTMDEWFAVLHPCNQPNFTPDTFVVDYLYFNLALRSQPQRSLDDSIEVQWSGYDTVIQDCSVFVPG